MLILALLLVPPVAAQAANVVPSGFEDTQVAQANGLTDLAFTPDGRMLATNQTGLISVRSEDGTLQKAVALNLTGSACSTIDRGLQSVAVDPAFATNHYIYVYYTSNKNGTCADGVYPNGPVNRLSRFVLADDNTVDPQSETVLIDNIASMNLHQGGDVEFGKDGYLYVSVGDGGCDYALDSGCYGDNDAARDANVLLGKILRITPDGAIPPDNPYTGENTARCNLTGETDPGKFCQETYASGLRNPWKLAFDPNAGETRFFINDVGQAAWEEIDLGQSGADYGWNLREGPCVTDSLTDCGASPAGITEPIHSYEHSNGCGTVTGGAFVPSGLWRAEDEGAYLYAEFNCGKIFELRPLSGGGFGARELLSGMGPYSIVAMTFGPFAGRQALYYSSWATAEIRRLAFTPPVQAPPAAGGSEPTVPRGQRSRAPARPWHVILSTKRLKLSSLGRVAIRLSCRGSSRCVGTLIFSADAAARRRLQLGEVWFSMAKGTNKSFTLHVSKRGQRLVRSHKALKVKIKVEPLLKYEPRTSYAATLRG